MLISYKLLQHGMAISVWGHTPKRVGDVGREAAVAPGQSVDG